MADKFVPGDRVMNTGNRNRHTIGVVTQIVDDEFCTVLWSGDGTIWWGTIRRDGTVNYNGIPGHEADRIVRVKLSVRIAEEV